MQNSPSLSLLWPDGIRPAQTCTVLDPQCVRDLELETTLAAFTDSRLGRSAIRDSQTTAWFAISWDAGLSVTINSLKGLLSSGHGDHAAFAITLWDNHRGAAVEGASIRLFARMPHHDRDTPGGHGLANDPDMRRLTAIPASPGHYTAEPIYFAMPGAWLVEIQVQQEGKTQRAYFATMVHK